MSLKKFSHGTTLNDIYIYIYIYKYKYIRPTGSGQTGTEQPASWDSARSNQLAEICLFWQVLARWLDCNQSGR